MKKELFGGKLKDPIGFVVGLSIGSFASVFLSVVLVIVIASGNNSITEKTILGITAALSLIFGIGHPILFIHVVKNRKKYPRLSRLLVKPGYFKDK